MSQAMANEDRDAVRVLLGKQQQAKKEPSETTKTVEMTKEPSETKKEPSETKKQKKRWWASLTDADPISLEPLAELTYPPFECGKHRFDGRVLAFYVVSTGTFENPMSREALTLDDCRRLDKYLDKHGLEKARVADAFKLQESIRSGDDQRTQRRHATAVLHSLFHGFGGHYDGGNTSGGGRALRAGLSGDDDDDEDDDDVVVSPRPAVQTEEDTIGDEVKEDFPALLQADDEAALEVVANHPGDWRTRIMQEQNVVETMDFPALGDSPREVTTVDQAPRFRDAVASFAAASHSARDDATATYYAQRAATVQKRGDDFPALPVSVGRPPVRRPVQPTTKQRRKRDGGPPSIVAKIRDAAGDRGLDDLRRKSLEFRRGDLSGDKFYDAAFAILPKDHFDDLFTGLVNVLPDVDARAELQALINKRRLARFVSPDPPPTSPRPPVGPVQPPPPPPPPEVPRDGPVQPAPRAADFPTLDTSGQKTAATKKKKKPPVTTGWSKALAKYSGSSTTATAKKIPGISVVVPTKKK